MVVGIFPMRLARFVIDQANGNGSGNGYHPPHHDPAGTEPIAAADEPIQPDSGAG